MYKLPMPSCFLLSRAPNFVCGLLLSFFATELVVAEATPDFNRVYGYAGLNGGTSGGNGDGARALSVCSGAQLIEMLNHKGLRAFPLTIFVDAPITFENSHTDTIKIERPNVSIIGRGPNAEFNGIGIHIRASNIIIRNLKLHEVPQNRGEGDMITIDGRPGKNASAPVRNIWIDHNEFYNNLAVNIPENITDKKAREEYQKDFYDELVSGRGDISNITISYNYFHDSWKTSLWGSSDEDNFNRQITFHHNRWENVNSRLPLIRFGQVHLFNNFYNHVDSTAINSRMGAIARVEHNYFDNTKNPVLSKDSSILGQWQLINNKLGKNIKWSLDEDEHNRLADSRLRDNKSTGVLNLPEDYQYTSILLAPDAVEKHVKRFAGFGIVQPVAEVSSCNKN
ncbi:MAG: pectate lyase [Cellvibrio sp.]